MADNLKKETSELATNNFGGLQFRSLDEVKNWGKEIVKSGLTPLKTPEAVVAAIMMGKELGLEPMISVNNIIPINGKATLGIHLINSLLLKAGIVTKIIRRYEPCVAFAFKGEDGKAYKGEDGNSAPTILRIGFIDEEPKEYEVKGRTIVDYKTIVRMSRMLRQPDGSYEKMEVDGEFSYNDAKTAGLVTKDNWKNYPAVLALKMATVLAGRIIGSDILLGMYETGEMADVEGIPYKMTEDGKVTIIESNVQKSKSNESFEEVKVETDTIEIPKEI
jgi:hypothetical protein